MPVSFDDAWFKESAWKKAISEITTDEITRASFIRTMNKLDSRIKLIPVIKFDIIEPLIKNIKATSPDIFHTVFAGQINDLLYGYYFDGIDLKDNLNEKLSAFFSKNYTEPPALKTFEKLSDLWIDDTFDSCVSLLKKEYKKVGIPAILNNTGAYVGTPKKGLGVLVGWYMAMEKKIKLHPNNLSQEKKRDLFLKEFTGLKTLNPRTLDKSKADQYEFYIDHFSNLV